MGGDYHLVEKRASLCSLSVCFWVFAIPTRTKKEEKGARQEKKLEGTNGPDPLLLLDDIDKRGLVAHTTSTTVLALAELFALFIDSMADDAELNADT